MEGGREGGEKDKWNGKQKEEGRGEHNMCEFHYNHSKHAWVAYGCHYDTNP